MVLSEGHSILMVLSEGLMVLGLMVLSEGTHIAGRPRRRPSLARARVLVSARHGLVV